MTLTEAYARLDILMGLLPNWVCVGLEVIARGQHPPGPEVTITPMAPTEETLSALELRTP